MSDDIIKIADVADVIINGYAFTRKNNGVLVINLGNPERVSFLSFSGDVNETSMDDIELDIVQEYYRRSTKYMEL